jgi:hypothetical protein
MINETIVDPTNYSTFALLMKLPKEDTTKKVVSANINKESLVPEQLKSKFNGIVSETTKDSSQVVIGDLIDINFPGIHLKDIIKIEFKVEDISQLYDPKLRLCTSLRSLNFNVNKIPKIEGLETLTKLEELFLTVRIKRKLN